MSILSPEMEKRLCLRLRSLVEEFGDNQVVVSLPEKWAVHSHSTTLSSMVKWEFTTKNTIDISVPSANIFTSELLEGMSDGNANFS